MRIKPLWIGIALSALTVLLYVWWISTQEKVWFDRPLPLQGEASYNRYYLLQQALRARGLQVRSLPHLQMDIDQWSNSDTLLLGAETNTLSPGLRDALLNWVARGGRVLVTTDFDHDVDGAGLLARIGIVPKSGKWCLQWLADGKNGSPQCFKTFEFGPSQRENFPVAVGDAGHGWIVARRSWGLGWIEVVGSFGCIENYGFKSAQDSDWAWQLLAPMLQGGVFHIVYQTELPPLYVYLVDYGWYALLPMLLALLAWLWARSQRFGPPLPLPAPDRRALGEHIHASGEFLFRRGLIPALYEPLRRRFDESLRRREPELAALPTADIARILAERNKLSLESVQQALRPPQPNQRKTFLATVQTLLYLIRHP